MLIVHHLNIPLVVCHTNITMFSDVFVSLLKRSPDNKQNFSGKVSETASE